MIGNRDIEDVINNLKDEYDLDHGFLGRLRQGVFDMAGLDRLIALLESIKLGSEPTIDRRLVALLWMIPTLMSWQIPRVAELGGDIAYLQRSIDKIQSRLNSILGTP